MNGKDVEKLRKKYDLTQQQLGDLLGMARQTVINIEKGKSPVPVKLKLLSKVLNDLEFLKASVEKSIKDVLEM